MNDGFMLKFFGLMMISILLMAGVAWGVVALTMRPWVTAISAQGKMLVSLAPLILRVCEEHAVLMRKSNPELPNGDSDPMRKSGSSPGSIRAMAKAVEKADDVGLGL